MLLVAAVLALTVSPMELGADEVLTFYPTWARYDAGAEVWRLPIHGHVFAPETSSLRRKVALGLLHHFLKLESESSESELFRQRAAPFLANSQGGRRLSIRLGESVYALAATRSNGHTETELVLAAAEARSLMASSAAEDGWLTYQAELPENDGRSIRGRVQLLDAQGFSIISDVDDTIKVTEATDRRAMLRNTFLREFEAVDGMAGLYQSWKRGGAAFHYVSAAPWQLYEPLSTWCQKSDFPEGSFDLRLFRLNDRTALELLSAPDEFKRAAIERLLAAFPERRFVLVGDSGEHDPEIYGRLARGFPDRILHVYIRNVTNEPADSPRFVAAFADVPRDVWQIFRKPGEISLAAPKPEK